MVQHYHDIMPYRFSVGFRSGEHEGQSMESVPTHSTSGQALSRTRKNPGPTPKSDSHSEDFI